MRLRDISAAPQLPPGPSGPGLDCFSEDGAPARVADPDGLIQEYRRKVENDLWGDMTNRIRDHQHFPIFFGRVFKTDASDPAGLFDYRRRQMVDFGPPPTVVGKDYLRDVGKALFLERTDDPSNPSLTRLFFVWLSPGLWSSFATKAGRDVRVGVHVLFHPKAGLQHYPADWRARNKSKSKDHKDKDFFRLGWRYLVSEKFSATQILSALKPSSADLKSHVSPFASSMLVVPVSPLAAYDNMKDPGELQAALGEICRVSYQSVRKQGAVAANEAPKPVRVSLSGFSRSGECLYALLAPKHAQHPFMTTIVREIYAFDIEINADNEEKPTAWARFWPLLTAWQGDDADRRIRIYSAEKDVLSAVYAELRRNLAATGGGDVKVGSFKRFNGKLSDGKAKLRFSGLEDGYELYSNDNSRILVVLPLANFLKYLDQVSPNPGGIDPNPAFEPGLQGHSWFVSRLFSHALFHSGF